MRPVALVLLAFALPSVLEAKAPLTCVLNIESKTVTTLVGFTIGPSSSSSGSSDSGSNSSSDSLIGSSSSDHNFTSIDHSSSGSGKGSNSSGDNSGSNSDRKPSTDNSGSNSDGSSPTPTSISYAGSGSSTPTPTETPTGSSSGSPSPSNGAATPSGTTSSGSGSLPPGRRLATKPTQRLLDSSSADPADQFTCDETFYGQWDRLGLKCGGVGIDVASAVDAASCVIYSGTVGTLTGSTCVSVCSFPACESDSWVYGADNGIASSVYDSVQLTNFMTSDMTTRLADRTSDASSFIRSSYINSTLQCPLESDDLGYSFDICYCAQDSASTQVQATQLLYAANDAFGIITRDDASASVVAPAAVTIARTTVTLSAVAAVAGTLVSTAGASTTIAGATASSSAASIAGASTIMAAIDLCQLSVFINEVNLKGKSAVLSMYGKQMAPAAFVFLPFGRLDITTLEWKEWSGFRTPQSTLVKYSRRLKVDERWLFVVTIAGVGTVLVVIVALFGLAYLLSGLCMAREAFCELIANRVVGLLLMVLILAQYPIGVTATYQIYHSLKNHEGGDWKCLLAIASLLLIGMGVIAYGCFVVKRHKRELADVGKETHAHKRICQRYGVLYGDYKFQSRYFFAAKMIPTLVSGMVVGYVGASAYTQMGVTLAAHVLFTLYLEVDSPHHDPLAQTTTTCVSVIKIAQLLLGFFLVEAKTADGAPTEGQIRINLAIVGLNVLGLLVALSRTLYPMARSCLEKRKAAKPQSSEQDSGGDPHHFYAAQTPRT